MAHVTVSVQVAVAVPEMGSVQAKVEIKKGVQIMNKVILCGNLGKDPEVRHTSQGSKVANFSLATRGWSNNEKATDWHKIVCWKNQAEYVGNYLSKGSKVLVEGRLQTRSWEDEQGNTKYITEVVAFSVEGMDKRDSSASDLLISKDAVGDNPPAANDDLPF